MTVPTGISSKLKSASAKSFPASRYTTFPDFLFRNKEAAISVLTPTFLLLKSSSSETGAADSVVDSIISLYLMCRSMLWEPTHFVSIYTFPSPCAGNALNWASKHTLNVGYWRGALHDFFAEELKWRLDSYCSLILWRWVKLCMAACLWQQFCIEICNVDGSIHVTRNYWLLRHEWSGRRVFYVLLDMSIALLRCLTKQF